VFLKQSDSMHNMHNRKAFKVRKVTLFSCFAKCKDKKISEDTIADGIDRFALYNQKVLLNEIILL